MKMIRLTSIVAFTLCLLMASGRIFALDAQTDAKAEAEQKALSCAGDDVTCAASGHNHTDSHAHGNLARRFGNNHPTNRSVSCLAAGCNGGPCKHEHCDRSDCNHAVCRDNAQRQRGAAFPCPVGKCRDGSCEHCQRFCPRHGQDCKHGCLKSQFGYGQMEVCPGKINGICPVHGYGACPHQRQPLIPALQQAFTPADRPYFADRPLYVPREQYDPNFQPRFPMVRAMFCVPPAPKYMTTKPVEPMPTYTTRGPRDFLNPNPPSIGY